MCNQQEPVNGSKRSEIVSKNSGQIGQPDAASGEDARPEEQLTFDQNLSGDESGESDDNWKTPASRKCWVFIYGSILVQTSRV